MNASKFNVQALLRAYDALVDVNANTFGMLPKDEISNGNIPMASSILFDCYAAIKERIVDRQFYRKSKKVKSVTIVDFGSGIGNVLHLFKTLFLGDLTLNKQGLKVTTIGYEIDPKMVQFANKIVHGNYHFNLRQFTEVEIHLKMKLTDSDITIFYCNNPLKDYDMNRLESMVTRILPPGGFYINPLGIKTKPENCREINNRIITKI